jgi:hypothetical protein
MAQGYFKKIVVIQGGCERVNEMLGSISVENFMTEWVSEWVSECWLLKKECAKWNWTAYARGTISTEKIY